MPRVETSTPPGTRQILDSFEVMLESVDSDLAHIVHINVFLREMADFEATNQVGIGIAMKMVDVGRDLDAP